MSGLVVRSGDPGRPVEFDERWQEVWLRKCRGEPFTKIAVSMGVHRTTVQSWYEKYAQLEVARSGDPDKERAFLIGRFENIALRSLEAFDTSLHESDVDWKSDPRPAHMANAIKALQMVARLSGLDVARSINLHQHQGESEIVIKVGGQEMVRRRASKGRETIDAQTVDVAAGEISASGGAAAGEAVEAEAAVSGDG